MRKGTLYLLANLNVSCIIERSLQQYKSALRTARSQHEQRIQLPPGFPLGTCQNYPIDFQVSSNVHSQMRDIIGKGTFQYVFARWLQLAGKCLTHSNEGTARPHSRQTWSSIHTAVLVNLWLVAENVSTAEDDATHAQHDVYIQPFEISVMQQNLRFRFGIHISCFDRAAWLLSGPDGGPIHEGSRYESVDFSYSALAMHVDGTCTLQML